MHAWKDEWIDATVHIHAYMLHTEPVSAADVTCAWYWLGSGGDAFGDWSAAPPLGGTAVSELQPIIMDISDCLQQQHIDRRA